jgi:HAD superfamily hydrolase (TIGR01509 family)
MSYRAVLLDIDGTLVDSNEAHVAAWVEALREGGYEVSAERIRPLIGMGGDHLLPAAVGLDKESEAGKRIARRHGELFKERLPDLRPFPGVRPLLERLQAEGLERMAATSAEPDEVEALLEIAGVTDLVQGAASADDAPSSKPDPGILQAALERLKCSPADALLLGDAPYDVEAAHRAGMSTLALRSGGFSDADLAGALAIYDDAADLLARYDESPLARRGG